MNIFLILLFIGGVVFSPLPRAANASENEPEDFASPRSCFQKGEYTASRKFFESQIKKKEGDPYPDDYAEVGSKFAAMYLLAMGEIEHLNKKQVSNYVNLKTLIDNKVKKNEPLALTAMAVAQAYSVWEPAVAKTEAARTPLSGETESAVSASPFPPAEAAVSVQARNNLQAAQDYGPALYLMFLLYDKLFNTSDEKVKLREKIFYLKKAAQQQHLEAKKILDEIAIKENSDIIVHIDVGEDDSYTNPPYEAPKYKIFAQTLLGWTSIGGIGITCFLGALAALKDETDDDSDQQKLINAASCVAGGSFLCGVIAQYLSVEINKFYKKIKEGNKVLDTKNKALKAKLARLRLVK